MIEELKKWFFWFWVDKHRISFLWVFLIIIVGLFSMITIPKESSPDIKFWIISISTSYPWVNPIDMDNLITEKIEQEIKDIEWIKKISSSSSVWSSSTSVELNNGVDTLRVLADIKDKVDAINFPEDANDPFVQEISTNNTLMFQLVVYWDKKKFSNFQLIQKAKKLQNDLEWSSGIASIDVWGVSSGRVDASSSSTWDYEIKVLISKERLEALGLSISQIASTIRQYNKNSPIWSYYIGDLSYDFRIDWELTKIQELEEIIIRDSWNSQLKLRDISEIVTEYKGKKLQSLGKYNETGLNYITLDFNKADWASIFSSAGKAKKVIEEYLNGNISFTWLETLYIKDLSETIKEDYRSLWKTALQTLVLVFLTILLFVWFRESLIASIILPLSFFITFIVLDTLGYSLNFLTNFSLVLTLWIAIDTIIIIVEWSSERQRLGYSRTWAVLLAVRDLKWPLISGTMTTLVAFLPMMFLPGIMWKFLAYIPITVFATLLAALVLSLTISSALFMKLTKRSKFFHVEPSLEKTMSKIDREFLTSQRLWKEAKEEETLSFRERILWKLGNFYYAKLEYFITRRSLRLASILIPVAVMIATFVFLSPKIGFTLFPPSDNNTINLEFKASAWTKSESLEKYVPQIDEVISQFEELKLFYTSVSGNSISSYVELTPNLERQDKGQRSVFEIEEILLEELDFLKSEWLQFEAKSEWWWPPGWKAIGVSLTANSSSRVGELKEIADEFEVFLKWIEWTKNVTISSSDTPWQFVFSFDRAKLANVGLQPDDIINELRSYTSGTKAGSIKSTYEDNDIVLKIKDFDENLSPRDVADLIITTKVWKIKVWDYLDSSFDKSLSSIKRENTKILIKVESDLRPWTLPTSVQPKLIEFAKDYNYPDGINYIAGWENEENAELIQSTLKSFVIALFLIFTILVLQFNSYSRPIIILYSVVLALIWVNIGLFLTWNPYSMPFAIWFIALTWIVVNDAIILLDRVVKNIARVERNIESPVKEDYVQAVVGGCKTRLQPIIVTTLTTLFWVLPLALQDAFWGWLGYTIIYGLFAWSFMTLFVVPSLYYEIYLRNLWKTQRTIEDDRAPYSNIAVLFMSFMSLGIFGILFLKEGFRKLPEMDHKKFKILSSVWIVVLLGIGFWCILWSANLEWGGLLRMMWILFVIVWLLLPSIMQWKYVKEWSSKYSEVKYQSIKKPLLYWLAAAVVITIIAMILK